jgi:hypothetical protein
VELLEQRALRNIGKITACNKQYLKQFHEKKKILNPLPLLSISMFSTKDMDAFHVFIRKPT